MKESDKLIKFHKKYVQSTTYKAIVPIALFHLCNLTRSVVKSIDFEVNNVYLSTRMLKHIYDKRTAEEYDFILNNLVKIVREPDAVCLNKSGRRGEFCLIKKIKDEDYLCSIEQYRSLETSKYECIQIVTCFRVRGNYPLKQFQKIFSWEGGVSPS